MVAASDNDRLVWIDCEMTGLDLDVDELVEIAVVVTDFELRPVHPGFQVVIKPDASALANMSEFVTKMHRSSGLLDEIPHGVSLADAEFQALEYIQQFVPIRGKAPLAGNTIGTDRMFLAKYMPRIDRWLHYRNVDVSSIKELSRRWYPRAYIHAPVERRRAPRARRHPRIDPRTRLLPAGRVRPRARARPATARGRPRRPSCRRSPPGCERIFWLPDESGAWWV